MQRAVALFRGGTMVTLGLPLLVATQLADYLTFIVMVSRHGITAELNPIVARLAEDHGLLMLTAAKLAAVVLVGATVLVVGRTRPRLAATVLAVGVISGGIGAFSNVATI
jgi:hypothetical protein